MMNKEELRARIEDLTPEMIGQMDRLVRFNSIMGEAKPGFPFGEEPAACLAEALVMADEMGFKTTNVDNYCGYAEIGEGEEIIGIAGHLDIVPVGDGWTHDPLRATVDGDKVYGRGVIDDKGPCVMALYAMKLLQESGAVLNKRVRVIMGTNEENGSKCMEYYTKVEEPLSMGFTPDANYPCIYGEKGHMSLMIHSKNTSIIAMNGGFVSNAVCHQCTTVIPAGAVEVAALKAALAATPLVSSTVTEENGQITIFAEGVAAHASMPYLGVNAASYTMAALKEAGMVDDFVDFYTSHVGTACDGEGCGLKLVDEYGDLTFNNGIVKTVDGEILCNIDIRVPVTYTEEQVRAACAPYLEDEKGRIEILAIGAPLFFPKESPLVQALYSTYVEVTGDTSHEPMVIGGGTYAKALPGILAFGPEMPGIDYRMHNADEFMDIEGIKNSVEIYVRALEKMLAL